MKQTSSVTIKRNNQEYDTSTVDIGALYHEYQKSGNPYNYKMGNHVLYCMCKDNPEHTDIDIIVSKLWLIGRSYAAAIERRTVHNDIDSDAFYYDVVAPKMRVEADWIDEGIARINKLQGDYASNPDIILELHKKLTKLFADVSGAEKRSLASKYLHFHCPNHFLIYDERTRIVAKQLVKRPALPIEWKTQYDVEYATFYARVVEIAKAIENTEHQRLTPREIDDFLLCIYAKNKA